MGPHEKCKQVGAGTQMGSPDMTQMGPIRALYGLSLKDLFEFILKHTFFYLIISPFPSVSGAKVVFSLTFYPQCVLTLWAVHREKELYNA